MNAYIRKLETSKINYLSFQLKKLEKEEKFELKISSNKAIRIRVENKNENTRYQNLWAATVELLRGKYIASSAYIRKEKRS